MSSVSIVLDGEATVYCPGQWVTGKVIISSKDSLKVNEIKLVVDGRAVTNWTTRSLRYSAMYPNSHIETEHFYGYHDYISLNIILIPKSKGSSTLIQSGTLSFPFQFQLPSICASTFAGEYGNIKYTLNATVDRFRGFDKNSTIFLNVVAQYDLNLVPNASLPVKFSDQKEFGMLFWKSGTLVANVYLRHQAFAVGQAICPVVEIVNQSTKSIKKIKAELKENITFYASGSAKFISRCIATSSVYVNVAAGQASTFTLSDFSVPLNAAVLINCSIIVASHEIQISITPSGLSSDLIFTIPITIGTIPIAEDPSNRQYQLQAAGSKTAQLASGTLYSANHQGWLQASLHVDQSVQSMPVKTSTDVSQCENQENV